VWFVRHLILCNNSTKLYNQFNKKLNFLCTSISSVKNNTMVLSKVFQCKHCEKIFTSNSGLWYHSKKCGVANPKKTHKCPHCDYTTSGPKCILQNHIYSKHTAEKDRPFQCMHCPRGFSQKSHLNKHMKKEHNMEAPENKDRNIIEYHIEVLSNIPVSEKAQSRMRLYKKNPIINAKNMENLKFWYTKKLKPSHLHYDSKKGYIKFDSKTISDLRTN